VNFSDDELDRIILGLATNKHTKAAQDEVPV
jgi:hypothetical protein